MSLQRCIILVTVAFAVLFFCERLYCERATEIPHRRPNSDRKHSERDIRSSAHGRCRLSSTPSLHQTFTSTTGASDSTGIPSWP